MKAAWRLALLALLACGGDDPGRKGGRSATATGSPSTGGPTPTTPQIAPPGTIDIVDRALEWGIQAGSPDRFERGRSCAVEDYDGDGWLDLFNGNPNDASWIFRNLGGTGFEPIFVSQGDWDWGATAGDLDNDGDPDVITSGGGNERVDFDRIYDNLGGLGFQDVAMDLGVAGIPDPTGTIVATMSAGTRLVDANNDGILDLWFDGHHPDPSRSADIPPQMPLGENKLWIQQPLGVFTNLQYAGEADRFASQNSVWLDVDNDGDADLYENNFRAPNRLYINLLAETGTLSLEDRTEEFGLLDTDLSRPLASFGAAAFDVNSDGYLDLFVPTRELSEPGEEHKLFLNVSGVGFVDAAIAWGAGPWGPPLGPDGVMGHQVADLNADGLGDIYIGNGGPFGGAVDHLFLSTTTDEITVPGYPPVTVPIYANWSDRIDQAAPEDGVRIYPTYPYRTHAVCIADFDQDGLLEIFVANGGRGQDPDDVREPNFFYEIEADPPLNYLVVIPKGSGISVPRSPYGTRVRAVVGRSGEAERWEVHGVLLGGAGFSAMNGPEIYLGLGNADVIDEVEVTWTDGHVDVLSAEINTRVVVDR